MGNVLGRSLEWALEELPLGLGREAGAVLELESDVSCPLAFGEEDWCQSSGDSVRSERE